MTKAKAKQLPFEGDIVSQSELSRRTGISRGALEKRLDSGLSVEEAVKFPPAERKILAQENAMIGAEMTNAMLKRVFQNNPDEFLAWVDEMKKNNMFKFMQEILPRYLKIFEAKEIQEKDETAVVNIVVTGGK